MSRRRLTVRGRLTLWYAGALAATLALFSSVVYVVVRANVLHEVAERAEESLAVVRGMIADEPASVHEIEEHGIASMFAIVGDAAPPYTSAAWRAFGLPEPATLASAERTWRARSSSGSRFVIASASDEASGSRRAIHVAMEEDPALRHLRTLGLVLSIGFPAAIAAAWIGGSLLAKRLLAPVGSMADAAGRITAERLTERLPIDNPDDEFGRLADAFNRTLARLQDAFERLRRFTADASHELRTPLTALRSVGEVTLRAPDFHERSRDTIVSMLEESGRLTELVDGLLLLTRESTDAYRARFTSVDLGLLVGEVVELFRALAEEKDQRLDARVDGVVRVHGDRATLRQALVNLVDNALKYTPRGGSIRVRVAASSDAASPGAASIEVDDTGPGIPEAHREKIFERFYRVDDDRSRAAGGAGLGLAIARWAVELNGGRVELLRTSSEGSTFRLQVPRSNA